MASQTTASRTYWTPVMERYFLDMMVEHMRSGNRIGHTFNKKAWLDMLTDFNAKFGTRYDKDVLKCRYGNMWKQFNDIKNLLGQNGFSWDEARQMVVADDHVWDAYVKAYPDMRPYKNKVVQNFNGLCLIYSYTTADGRYSHSSHDVDIEDEGQGPSLGDGSGSLVPSCNERLKTDWTLQMDQYLVELMLNQTERGNKIGNTFSKKAWTDMLSLFNSRFGPQHRKRVLQHRYRKLWKYFSDITVLLRQSSFSWDNSQHVITARDDVWDALIKVHPHMRSYRAKALPNYSDMVLVFGEPKNAAQIYLHHGNEVEDDVIDQKTEAERSRTYWTPPMDHFFIDLLLDQVHRGNRIGHTFISQAWIDMVTSFNANFKSHYTKYVLKNRYKHLRRQYSDVKQLLGQSGFTWDEARNMVTAADTIWEAYLKVHPDARSYRVKIVPCHDKLCAIFGDENPDAYSHIVENVNAQSEFLTSIGEVKGEEFLATTDPEIDWGPSMDHYFIDLMLKQVFKGKKIGRTIDDQTWDCLISLFNQKFVLQCNKDMLEDRYMCLKKYYVDISSLLNQNGFGWDESQQMVVAAADVWDSYIKVHPDATAYRNKAFKHYRDLCVIFGPKNAIHDEICLGREGAEFIQNPQSMRMDAASSDASTLAMENDQKEKWMTGVPSPSKHLHKVQKVAENGSMKLCINKSAVGMSVAKRTSRHNTPVECAIVALQEIPEMDDDVLLDGCDLLEDERRAKTFLALDGKLRKKWLMRKLGHQ